MIRIRQNGNGDFRTEHTSVTGGRVIIDENELSIFILGLGHKWRIDSPPAVDDGQWTMKLDGQVFKRKADGVLACSNFEAISGRLAHVTYLFQCEPL